MISNKESVSVAEATRELLERKPFLKELMNMDAVNYRGLARNFREEVEEKTGREKVNLDSIVMAIRRYEEDVQIREGLMETVQDVLSRSELTMKSDIYYYTFPRTEEIQEKAIEAHSRIDTSGNDSLHILQSEAEIVLVVDGKNSGKIDEIVGEDKTKNVAKDQAMVVVDSPSDIRKAHGILSHMTEKIIANGIGLTEMMMTYTETIFLVPEEDGTDLYNVLREMKNQSASRTSS